jgi:hypothetical protein
VRAWFGARRIVKLVRALRKGWIQTTAERAAVAREEAPAYLLWQDDGLASDKTLAGAPLLPSSLRHRIFVVANGGNLTACSLCRT